MARSRWSRLHIPFFLALLLLLFARLVLGSVENAVTADEPSHLTSGYAFLARGQGAFWTIAIRGHPLLADAWLALPIYLADPDIPLEALPGWQEDYGLYVASFSGQLEPMAQWLFLGRVPGMLMTMLLAAVVARWARDLWGPRAALLSLVVLVFDPTLVAHGRLATNDLGVVAVGTLALYVAWRWWRQGGWGRAVGVGVLMAWVMLCKQSGVVWVAAFGLGTILVGVLQRRPTRYWAQTLVIAAVALGAVWAAYGFSFGPVSGLPIPLPGPEHWGGILRHRTDTNQRLVYALGQRQAGNWWWYFFLAFLIKNPLPLLIAVGVGGVVLARRPVSLDRLCALGLFAGLYTVVAVLVGMNIGYRHVLPIHPMLYLIAAAGLDRWLEIVDRKAWARWALVLMALWTLAGAVWIAPYELSYFNELVGGAENGYRFLSDSNLDWGQYTYAREDYLREHPEAILDPPSARYLPAPGRYVIGASYWSGLGLGDPDVYEWFRHREPDDVYLYGTLIYDVPETQLDWLAQCDTPRVPLEGEAIAAGLGDEPPRMVHWNCQQAWLYPGGGTGQGLYALHRELVDDAGVCCPSMLPCSYEGIDPFVASHLRGAAMSFEQLSTPELPPSVLYEWKSGEPVAIAEGGAFLPVAGLPPDRALVEALDEPVFGQGLAYLGARAYRDGKGITVETWWRVEDGPFPQPFSIMGQLVSRGGEVLGMYDKLGISPLELQTGDVLVQRHLYDDPGEREDLWLRTGVYWLDRLARWEIDGVPGADMVYAKLEVEKGP